MKNAVSLGLLSVLFQQAAKKDRESRPYIIVPQGVDTTQAVDNAIKAGFPVEYCTARHCAPSPQYTR